ncbi:MAG: tRNA uridine-5-carboxymethylaminomethyl(34) synthesis GTPase MnmE [Planctomycetes bacterium]|nr:tRNA uridine-5-carboxymethylaminomethyl(34) synthesis GTPase MnmE [Planctomycetota bacterium]
MTRRSTIAAIASPPGPGARGVIRVSGPRAFELVRACASFDEKGALASRGAWRGRLHDGEGTQPLLALAMPGPRSFTREDVCELHLSGSPPLLAAALARLVALGAELAAPGEFTRRAFESGRIDLSQAEGVLELVAAQDEAERRAATELLFGGLSRRLASLRARLLELRVLCEASLDFDEADTGNVPREELREAARAVEQELDVALGWERERTRRTQRPRVVLVGRPNAGKSALFNALVGGAALVSERAGTTRDALRGVWRLARQECELVDTAGESAEFLALEPDHPDRVAQRVGENERLAADLRLRVYDAREAAPSESADELLVRAKCDRALGPGPGIQTSALDGRGLVELAAAVERALASRPTAAGSGRELSQRHVEALRRSRERVAEGRALLEAGGPLDLVAQSLRAALDALDAIAGHTSPEDVLDALFARFCLGK